MPIHARTPDGGPGAETPLELAPEPDWWAGGHGLCGTAGAYARFIRALLRGGELDGERILSQETRASSRSATSCAGVPMPSEGIKTACPELLERRAAAAVRQSWGLGFHLVARGRPGDAARQAPATGPGIFNLYYWIDPASGIGGMFLTQVLPFFDMPVVDTFAAIEENVYAQLGAVAAA